MEQNAIKFDDLIKVNISTSQDHIHTLNPLDVNISLQEINEKNGYQNTNQQGEFNGEKYN